jgi:YfiH family protein
MPDDVPGFVPDWHLPSGVEAWQTCRGIGPMPYGGFNLGQHVGDDPAMVAANRNHLLAVLPAQPVWLDQVHGTRVLELPTARNDVSLEADAVMTNAPGVVCAVMTADCLPVLLADKAGRVIGAAHAGWRGLAAGVLEALVDKMTASVHGQPEDLLAWLGPAIGSAAFEVGDDVRDAFVSLDAANGTYFKSGAAGKWLADLPGIATAKLRAMGLSTITPSGCCTYTQSDRFYSFRHDQVTGRTATMIWIKP